MEIKRDYYLNKIVERKNNGLIKIITGIRRCGKSYLLNTIFESYLIGNGISKSHIIKVALDDVGNKSLLDGVLLSKYVKEQIIDDDMYYVILDEIQLVDDFVGVLNGLLRINNIDIYVTGSNSKFLSSDIATEFRGRGDEIRVYPLSFDEFYLVNKEKNIYEAWKDYYTYGGLPLTLLQKSEEGKMNYLKNQQKNVYLNDVVERNKIQNDQDLEILVEIIASNIGSLTNPLKLANTFKSKKPESTITDKTIYSYLSYLQDDFIVEKANRYDIKGKKYIDTPQKYYFTDIGIRNAFLNFRQQEENHIMENIIYLELRKRGFIVDVGVVEAREKDSRKQLEIDFIANKGNNKYYIQSALTLDSEGKGEQENKSLLNVKDFFKKIVVTTDDIKIKRDENGIITMSIFDFLLNPDSLDY